MPPWRKTHPHRPRPTLPPLPSLTKKWRSHSSPLLLQSPTSPASHQRAGVVNLFWDGGETDTNKTVSDWPSTGYSPAKKKVGSRARGADIRPRDALDTGHADTWYLCRFQQWRGWGVLTHPGIQVHSSNSEAEEPGSEGHSWQWLLCIPSPPNPNIRYQVICPGSSPHVFWRRHEAFRHQFPKST